MDKPKPLMKNLLVSIALLTVLFCSCKKKNDPTPAPVDPTDYADSLVGSYKGQQTVTYNFSTTFSDANGTVAVTKVAKNQVKVVYFYSPYTKQVLLDCSNGGTGIINLNPTPGYYMAKVSQSTYFCSNNPFGQSSNKYLLFDVKETPTGSVGNEYYFGGFKQ